MSDTEIITPDKSPVTLETELEKARTDTVSISEADYVEAMRMAEEIGKVKMAQAISSGLSLSIIRWFAAMKENKTYKGKVIIAPNGKGFRPETFEELCKGMGFSRQNIDEHLRNYATLGGQLFEEAQTLGLKVRDMRKVRKALKDAPEETKKEVFSRLRESAPEDLKTALDVVCAQLTTAKKEKEALEGTVEEMKKDATTLKETYTAQTRVLEAKNAQYDELNEKYLRATSPHPADVEMTKLAKNQNARNRMDEKSNAALLAVAELAAFGQATLADEDIDEDTAAYVHRRVSLAVKDMAARILGAGIDVDLEAEFVVDYGETETHE